MTVEGATARLFRNGHVLVNGFIRPDSYKESVLRIHWGSFDPKDETGKYYMAHFKGRRESFSPLGYDIPELSRLKTVESTYAECVAAWATWRDDWGSARDDEDIRVTLGSPQRFVRPTSYRLMFHLSQVLMLARAEPMTPPTQKLVKGLDRLIGRLIQQQEAVIPA